MSETPVNETSSSEPPTTPVQAQPPVVAAARPSRLGAVAAWVGIVAGIVFIVAVIFFSGFILGKQSGGYHRHHGGHDGPAMIFRKGPPPMMGPMGPMGPHGQFHRPDAPDVPQPPTSTPARP